MDNKHIIRAEFYKTRVDASARNIGLDVVRGICVILIISAHTNNILKPYLPVYRLLYPLGEVAQDLFFALSGYLIGSQILKMVQGSSFGRKALLGFYIKRWIRTIPFYFIFLIVNMALFHFVYSKYGPDFTKYDFKAWPYFLFSHNLINRPPYFYPEIWPIPIEEWSYVLLPLPFIFFSRFFAKGNNFAKTLGYLIFLIMLVQVLRMIHIYRDHPETDWDLRKIVLFRMDALAYGFILAVLVKEEKIKNCIKTYRRHLLVAGCLQLFLFTLFKKYLNADGYNMLLFIYQPFICTLILPYFIYQVYKPNAITAVFTHLSLTGYAFLLSHLYFLQFLFITFLPTNTFFYALGTTVVYLIVLFFFSTFFYNKVERPILLMRKR